MTENTLITDDWLMINDGLQSVHVEAVNAAGYSSSYWAISDSKPPAELQGHLLRAGTFDKYIVWARAEDVALLVVTKLDD